MSTRHSIWNPVGVVTVISLVLAGVAYALPTNTQSSDPVADHLRLVIVVLLTSLCAGAAVEFLRGLRVFKAGMRRAYQLFAASIIMLSVSFLQLPIAGLFGLWGSWWINGGGVVLPFVATGALMYGALRQLGLLLDITGRLMSYKVVIVATAAAAIGIGVVAHFVASDTLEGAAVYIAVVSWSGAFVLCSVLLTRRIARVIGDKYQLAMQRLELALSVLFLGCLHESVTSLFVGYGDAFIDYGIFMWPFVLTGFLLVVAGYTFNQVGSYEAVVRPSPNHALSDNDYLDSITGIAVLASRPEDIDPILDGMRKVTSIMSAKDTLTVEDKKHLLRVYHQIEDYLVRDDPLRSFSRAELRQRSRPAFRELLADK